MKHFLIFLALSLIWSQNNQVAYGQRKMENEPVDTTWYVRGDVNYNLLVAAYLGRDKDVARFLGLGAYVNTTTMSGNTPLILASGEGHLSTAALLLSQDANINDKNKEGVSPLLQATLNNHPKMIAYLLEHGADADIRDNYGRTPLMEAAAQNLMAAGKILLKHGADPDAADKQGTTPLMAAVYSKNADFAKMLLEAGADINQKDNHGFTALLIATQNHDPGMVDFLISRGADIFIRTNSGYSPLLLAVQEKEVTLAEKFISLDSTGFFKKRMPLNPVKLASENKDPGMKDLLLLNDYRETFSPYLHDLRFGTDVLLNGTNFFPGICFGITEGTTKLTFYTGFNYRIYPARVLVPSSEHVFYQYWEYRGIAYTGAGRDFPFVANTPHKPGFGAYVLISGFVSFGPSYAGSKLSPKTILMVSPSGGLYMRTGPVHITVGYSWLNLKTYDFPDSYASLKVEYILSRKKISKSKKTIPWYH